jgi:hypothetical protein
MWIEEDIQKDTRAIKKTVQDLARDYRAQLPRTIHSNLTENKDNTNDFFKKFYEKLRGAEYEIYRRFPPAEDPSSLRYGEDDRTKLAYDITEIKNSANDLPHPRILSELQRLYDIRRNTANTGEDDRYIPYKVYTYIREKSEFCIRFQTTIHNRTITVYFITFPESHFSVCSRNSSSSSSSLCASEIAVYQMYAYKVMTWLSIVTSISDRECSEKSLNVYFYMTPFKKQRPKPDASGDAAILSAINVNTGLTRNCETHGEIVVYRTEEWFKVFVHESMHNFNMDFIDQDLRGANAQLRRTFCIPHDDILLFETYTETWARIINTMFSIYFQENGSAAPSSSPTNSLTQAHFIRAVREKITENAIFYVFQAVKVLDIMDLRYAHITIQTPENTEVCRKQYAEDTNVYAYYILGGILSVYALPFISWCCETNRGRGGRVGAIRFSRNGGILSKFVDFISRAARDPVMLSMVALIEKKSGGGASLPVRPYSAAVYKTMRMTME